MSMKRFRSFSSPTPMTITADWAPLRNTLDALMNGVVQRNVFAGGTFELDGSSSGSFDLPGWIPIEIDNSSNRITGFSDGTAVLKVQFRFLLYTTSSGVTVTPRIYDITAAAAATISGQTACSATALDFSGANQQQTVSLTLPNAKHVFKPQVTIGGTPAAGVTVKGIAMYDCFIDL